MTWFLLMIGHGRALELYLALMKLGLGVWIVTTGVGVDIPVLYDLAWYYPSALLAAPLLAVGFLQFSGWILNCTGFEVSWLLRAIASQGAIFMWFWLIFKTPFAGATSPIFVIGVLSLPFSVLLFYKAWNRLPIPGVIGLR